VPPARHDLCRAVEGDAAPDRVRYRRRTGAKSVKDIKEQDVYMGDIPLMTMNGTFVVNGTERVIVSQMHRSPGVFFDHDKGQDPFFGQTAVCRARDSVSRLLARYRIPTPRDIVFARIDRRRKIPVTSLMFALGLDGETILSTFYKKDQLQAGQGWLARAVRRHPFPRLQHDQRPD